MYTILTLALNCAVSTPLFNEDCTAVTSISISLSICIISSSNPSLYLHCSSTNASLSIIETCTEVATVVGVAVSVCVCVGESTLFGFALPLLPSTILNFLLSDSGPVPIRARSKTVCPLLWSLEPLPVLWSSDILDRWSASICLLCVSRSWIFLRNCFTYSMVSPNIEALSIFVTNGTNDLKIMNLSLSFSRRRRSARTWFALSSSCGVPLRNLEAASPPASRDLGEFSSRYLLCKNGTLNRMYLRSHWEVPSTGMGRWWSDRFVHLAKADWVE